MASKGNAKRLDTEKYYGILVDVIGKATALPMVRVDRTTFLTAKFKNHPELDRILVEGTTSVLSIDEIRTHALKVVSANTKKTSGIAFMAGLPSSPLAMIPAGMGDTVQYFGYAIRMAQEIAYLYGDIDIFTNGNELSEEGQNRLIMYLGTMFGVSGAASLVKKNLVPHLSTHLAKKVVSKPLTKTTWYPLLKRVAAALGYKITKQALGKTITKSVPVIGGVVSGGLTWATFKPLGNRLIEVFEDQLRTSENETTAEPEWDVIDSEVLVTEEHPETSKQD